MDRFEFADVDILMDNLDGAWTASLSGRTLEGDDLQDVLNQLRNMNWQVVQLNSENLPTTYKAWQTNSATIAYCAFVKRLCDRARAE